MSDVQPPWTPDWHYGEKLVIKKLDGKVADRIILRPIAPLFARNSHGPTTPIFAHALTCVGPTIVTMGTFVLIRVA